MLTESDDERQISVGQFRGVVSHPVNVVLSAEEDQEEVEGEVDYDKEELACEKTRRKSTSGVRRLVASKERRTNRDFRGRPLLRSIEGQRYQNRHETRTC
jgi:hypothetical protein